MPDSWAGRVSHLVMAPVAPTWGAASIALAQTVAVKVRPIWITSMTDRRDHASPWMRWSRHTDGGPVLGDLRRESIRSLHGRPTGSALRSLRRDTHAACETAAPQAEPPCSAVPGAAGAGPRS